MVLLVQLLEQTLRVAMVLRVGLLAVGCWDLQRRWLLLVLLLLWLPLASFKRDRERTKENENKNNRISITLSDLT
jgi:predicted tellurium resistance membrane protein TerC